MDGKKLRRVSVPLVLILGATLVPGFICSLLGFSGAAGLSALGAFAGTISTSLLGTRYGVRVAVGTGVATTFAVLSAHTPWAACLLFAAMGVLIGVLGRDGSWVGTMYVPLAAGFVLGENPTIYSQPTIDALLLGLIMGASALFSVVVTAWVLRARPPRQLTPITLGRAWYYGASLGLLMGIAAAALTAKQLAHTGSWVILTIIVVNQPYVQDAWSKALQRTGGTILGFGIAIVIALLIPWSTAIYIIATVAALLAIYSMFEKWPYWRYAIPLTVTIVLFEGASTSIIDTADKRLLATLAGAGASLLLTAISIPFARRSAHAKGLTHY